MTNSYICDAIRTPIGRFGGSLSTVRADDLGAIPLKALMERNPGVDWSGVDDLNDKIASLHIHMERNRPFMGELGRIGQQVQ